MLTIASFYDTGCKYNCSTLRIAIGFTKAGLLSFDRLNAKLGKKFIRFYQMKRELAEYIERHIDAGCGMDAEFDVLYDDGIMLTVYLSGGIYYIKEVTDIGVVTAIRAVMVWERFKRGCSVLVRQTLACWACVTAPKEAAAGC